MISYRIIAIVSVVGPDYSFTMQHNDSPAEKRKGSQIGMNGEKVIEGNSLGIDTTKHICDSIWIGEENRSQPASQPQVLQFLRGESMTLFSLVDRRPGKGQFRWLEGGCCFDCNKKNWWDRKIGN